MHLCITFDYELFFGDNNGTYDEVLFQPTYALINALEKKGVSATFFADVCSIPVARKYQQDVYVEGFQKQLQYMKRHGQDIQLHLHPHWNYATWNGEKWNFSNRGYRLHEFEQEGGIKRIIREGVDCLKDVLIPIDSNYECIAYRAGGFSMQPHEDIVAALYDNGIKVDSSIAPCLYTESEANYYDYRHRLERMNWHISDKDAWWKDSREGKYLLEIPIATIDKSPLVFALRRIFTPNSIKLALGEKRGSYITIHTKPESKIRTYYKYITSYNSISLDAYTADYLYKQTERLYTKAKCDDFAVAVIGHPKLVTDAYIDNLCRYIDRIKEDPRFDIVSIYDAYQLKETSYEKSNIN